VVVACFNVLLGHLPGMTKEATTTFNVLIQPPVDSNRLPPSQLRLQRTRTCWGILGILCHWKIKYFFPHTERWK